MLHAIRGPVTGLLLAVWVKLNLLFSAADGFSAPRDFTKTGAARGGEGLHPDEAAQAVWIFSMAQRGFL